MSIIGLSELSWLFASMRQAAALHRACFSALSVKMGAAGLSRVVVVVALTSSSSWRSMSSVVTSLLAHVKRLLRYTLNSRGFGRPLLQSRSTIFEDVKMFRQSCTITRPTYSLYFLSFTPAFLLFLLKTSNPSSELASATGNFCTRTCASRALSGKETVRTRRAQNTLEPLTPDGSWPVSQAPAGAPSRNTSETPLNALADALLREPMRLSAYPEVGSPDGCFDHIWKSSSCLKKHRQDQLNLCMSH